MSARTVSARHTADLDDRPVLLVTTVDIGDGNKAQIEVKEGDDCVTVAHNFCQRHGLPDSIVEPLAEHIAQHLVESDDHQNQQVNEEYIESNTYRQMDDQPSARQIHSAASSPGTARVSNQQTSGGMSLAETVGARSNAAGNSPQKRNSTRPASAALPRTVSAATTPTAHYSEHSQQLVAAEDYQYNHYDAEEENYSTMDHYHQQQQRFRPASATSSLGAEYYGRPLPSVSAGRTAEAIAAPAPDRLYADHFRKQRMLEEQRRIRDLEIELQTGQVHSTPVSRALAAHRNAAGYHNYGERLYVEGRLDAMRKERIAAEILREEEEAELAQYTFQPEISNMAKTLKEVQSHSGAAYWDRLYRKGSATKTQLRAQAIRREQEAEELKECSFKPQTDKRSNSIMRSRREAVKDIGLDLHNQLFNEANRREQKLLVARQRLPDDATFMPKVNTSSVVLRELTKNKGEFNDDDGIDVATRLLKRGEQRNQKVEAIRKALAEPIDPKTGRPMFQPATHRAPKVPRNPSNAPIGEYLYAVAEQSAQKAQQQVEAARQNKLKAAAKTHVNPLSEKLMDRLKRERFRAIYCYLGHSGSGDSVPSSINLIQIIQNEPFMNTIDPEVRADVEHATRILAKSLAGSLTERCTDENDTRPGSAMSSIYSNSPTGEVELEGFYALMEDVLDKTRGIARSYLQPLPNVRQKFEEPTFKPAIDRLSKQLATRSRPDHVPTHEVLYRTAAEVEAKREEKRRALVEAELKECSFKPTMIAGSPSKAPPNPSPRKLNRPLTVHTKRQQSLTEEALAAAEESFRVAQQQKLKSNSRRTTAQQPPAAAVGDEHSPSTSYLERHLSQASRRLSGTATPPLQPFTAAASPVRNASYNNLSAPSSPTKTDGSALEDGIDAIERQIQEAMTRLTMSSKRISSSISLSANGSRFTEGVKRSYSGTNLLNQSHQASLDYGALFGSPSEVAKSVTQSHEAHSIAALGASSYTDVNPMDAANGLTPTGAMRWRESVTSGDVVADINVHVPACESTDNNSASIDSQTDSDDSAKEMAARLSAEFEEQFGGSSNLTLSQLAGIIEQRGQHIPI